MANYTKKVRGENSTVSADEIGSHNFVQIFGDGSGKIVVCFMLMLTAAALVYLWITMHVLLVVIMVGALIVFCIIGVSATWRHVSTTKKVHELNKSEIQWSRILYKTENLVATLNRHTGVIEVHNAQEVSIQHHHAAPQMQISEHAGNFDDDIMPPLSTRNGQ